MLYIENIDDCTFRMYGSNVAQAGVKVLSKMGLAAKAQEPAYNESTGRVSIYNYQKDEKLLNHKAVSSVLLDGVLYANAETFVNAFNNLMAECCCGSGSGSTTEIIDWLETISEQIAALIQCNCRDCNEAGMGSVEDDDITFDANTLNSITIIVETGSVTISAGEESVTLIKGETVTFNASSKISNAITIDATGEGNKAVYVKISCNETATTTTTTTVCENLAYISTSTPDFVLEYPSNSQGAPN